MTNSQQETKLTVQQLEASLTLAHQNSDPRAEIEQLNKLGAAYSDLYQFDKYPMP